MRASRKEEAAPGVRSLQPVLFGQLARQVLLGDEGDAPAGEGLDLVLAVALGHGLELSTPFLVLEPWVLEHLADPAVIAFVEADRRLFRDAVALGVPRGNTDEAGPRHRHAHGLVGEVDRALLDHRIDVKAPGIDVHDHVDGQPELVVHAVDESTHAARRLTATVDDHALFLLPELVLVEATPDRFLFDEEDVARLVLAEFDHVRLHDGGHTPAAGPLAS